MPRILLAAAAAATAFATQAPVPVWPAQYIASGVISLPYLNLTETFTTWYDGVNGRQTISYFNGMDQYIYRSDINVTWQVSPVVTALQCFLSNGSVSLTTFLPDTTNMTFMGNRLVNDQLCDWFEIQVQEEAKVSTYDLFVLAGTAIPVRYHMLGFDSLLGSHYDEYVFDYTSFNATNNFPAGIFNQPQGMNCGGGSSSSDSSAVPQAMGATGNALIRELIPSSPEAYTPTTPSNDPHFAAFTAKYGKTYADSTEEAARHARFTRARRLIDAHNKKARAHGRSLRLAMNVLGDATAEEMNIRRGLNPDGSKARNHAQRMAKGNGAGSVHPVPSAEKLSALPAAVDWRQQGAVEPVQDQGICGSCWSHGATATISGSYFLKYGTMHVFSKQMLVDCSWPYGNQGCGGGEDFAGYQWIMQNGGLATRDNYGPYLMQNGWCAANRTQTTAVLTGYVNVTSGSESALMDALANVGPISISLDAAVETFDFYSDGVYDDPACSSNPADQDHTVTAVGYGTDPVSGLDYWIVKNSWSTHWGGNANGPDGGYIMIARENNICGVTISPTYVTLA